MSKNVNNDISMNPHIVWVSNTDVILIIVSGIKNDMERDQMLRSFLEEG